MSIDLSSAPPPSLLDDYLYSTIGDPRVRVTSAIAAWLLKAVGFQL
jgi:hypothetical protein